MLQIDGAPRLVVDCNVNPVELVGQFKITLDPDEIIASNGGGGNVRLNTVPKPDWPPASAVPYSVFPDKTKPPDE